MADFKFAKEGLSESALAELMVAYRKIPRDWDWSKCAVFSATTERPFQIRPPGESDPCTFSLPKVYDFRVQKLTNEDTDKQVVAVCWENIIVHMVRVESHGRTQP